MISARAAMEKEKKHNDGYVVAGPPKQNKQRAITDDVLERFAYYYVRGRSDAKGMPQPQHPRGPPPSHIIEAHRFAKCQLFVVSSSWLVASTRTELLMHQT